MSEVDPHWERCHLTTSYDAKIKALTAEVERLKRCIKEGTELQQRFEQGDILLSREELDAKFRDDFKRQLISEVERLRGMCEGLVDVASAQGEKVCSFCSNNRKNWETCTETNCKWIKIGKVITRARAELEDSDVDR